MGASMARPLPVALMGAELFSSSLPGELANGISERSILSVANRMEAFLMAPCSSIARIISTEPLTMAVTMGSAQSTSCHLGLLANGMRACSIAFKKRMTVIVRSAILSLTGPGIFMGSLAKLVM